MSRRKQTDEPEHSEEQPALSQVDPNGNQPDVPVIVKPKHPKGVYQLWETNATGERIRLLREFKSKARVTGSAHDILAMMPNYKGMLDILFVKRRIIEGVNDAAV